MQVMIETHTQLFRGSRQGGIGVPGPHTLLGARTKATSRLRTRWRAPSSAALLCSGSSGYMSTKSRLALLARVRVMR